ncbi:hypothetical protein T09_9661, partial [Trichinella sp. T9]
LSSSNPYRSPRLCSASTIRQSNQAVSITVHLIPVNMFVRVSTNVLKTGYDKIQNGKIEWMPAPFFLCRLPPEICSNPCACCCVADCECKTTTKLRNVQS